MSDSPLIGYDLIDAASLGDLGRVRTLLAAGADPDTQHVINRYTPLIVAACAGHLEVIKALIAGGAQVDLVAGDAPTAALESAAVAGRRDVVAWLLEHSASPPAGRAAEQLLDELSGYGEHEIVETLRRHLNARR